MVSHSIDSGQASLTGLLENTLQALARLHGSAVRLCLLDAESLPGFPAFSLAQLDRLRALIRPGAAAITRRLKELSANDKETGFRPAEFWRVESATSPAEGSGSVNQATAHSPSRSLLTTYRAACRSLCASLQEARRTSDSTTAIILSSLLQRLEKQLWLLDSSPERTRVGLPTIDLFLSC